MDTRQLKQAYAHLVADKYYKEAKTYVDYDGVTRFEGEIWKFVGSSFLAYESGLSLFFRIKGKVVQVRLQAIPEEQSHITEHLDQYFVDHNPWWQFW